MIRVTIEKEDVGHRQCHTADRSVIVIGVGVAGIVGAHGVVVLLLSPTGGDQRLNARIAFRGIGLKVRGQIMVPGIADI